MLFAEMYSKLHSSFLSEKGTFKSYFKTMNLELYKNEARTSVMHQIALYHKF